MILFNIITGLLVDGFGALREEDNDRRDILENSCFVCGMFNCYSRWGIEISVDLISLLLLLQDSLALPLTISPTFEVPTSTTIVTKNTLSGLMFTTMSTSNARYAMTLNIPYLLSSHIIFVFPCNFIGQDWVQWSGQLCLVYAYG